MYYHGFFEPCGQLIVNFEKMVLSYSSMNSIIWTLASHRGMAVVVYPQGGEHCHGTALIQPCLHSLLWELLGQSWVWLCFPVGDSAQE